MVIIHNPKTDPVALLVHTSELDPHRRHDQRPPRSHARTVKLEVEILGITGDPAVRGLRQGARRCFCGEDLQGSDGGVPGCVICVLDVQPFQIII